MSDLRWMRSALTLARRSLGRTWPNPAVGAVLVRDGRVLGRGATAPGGRPHAEAVALDQARALGNDPAGATAYVTLEPCAHQGQTPPCADALINAGIRRVVCPISDTDARVSGRGFERLRAAGIPVEVGLCADEARRLNAGFFKRTEQQRPFVVLKLATTLDGKIAMADGESQWITGPDSRRMAHLMRAQADAVLIGAGTARADDPALTVRDLGLDGRSPIRMVLDGALSLPLSSNLARTASTVPVWIFHRSGLDPERIAAVQDVGIETIETRLTDTGTLDVADALSRAAHRGITRILCEGGGQIAAALLQNRLVDEIALFTAGKIIGQDGLNAVASLGMSRLQDAPAFTMISAKTVGGDQLSLWRPQTP